MDPLVSALHRNYGWDVFRFGQRPVLDAILAGQDVLAVMPTGGGKSVCYQLPALIRNGLVVVISPLVALMEDQVMQLESKGIPAACLHAGLNSVQLRESIALLRNDHLRLIYLAPERAQSSFTSEILKQKAAEGKIVALAVDEAHCISAWGHDFRPDYRKLGEIRSFCPGVPVMALSATAAPKVRADIIRLLNLRKPFVQVCSARRSNLHYSMRLRAKEPLPEVLEILKSTRGAALIYARTRRSVDRWTESLRLSGVPAIAYHAGLTSNERQKAQAYLLEEANPVLVATVAFGMGVDRGDVGLVLHLDLPSTPEGYLQQSGRAGRDGKAASCVVLFTPGDRTRLGWAIHASSLRRSNDFELWEEKNRVQIAQEQARCMEAIAEGTRCREQALLLVVGEIVAPCGRCDRCKQLLPLKDWSENASALLEVVNSDQGVDVHSLSERLTLHKEKTKKYWGWLARRLVQEQLIRESNDGAQRLFMSDRGLVFLQKPWELKYPA